MAKTKIQSLFHNGFFLILFVTMFLAIGAVYLKYPLNDELLVLGDGTSSILITEWFGEQYASGQLPLWSRESAAGIPISSHMLGAFFLPSVLFSWLPLPWFAWMNYTFFVSFGACMFSRFLEEINIRRWLATLMGFMLLFAVCYGGARKNHVAIIQSISLYPLVLFAFQRYINTQSRSALVFAGLGVGSMLLVATPSIQYGMYLMIGMFVYVLVESIHRKVGAAKVFTDACLFLIVTVGIAAVQVVPGYELMQRYASMSISRKIPFESFTSYSIHPLKLLIMFFPNMLSDVYCGFGDSFSSGMDIELFLGTAAGAVLLFGLVRYRFDRRVRLLTFIATGAFLYASHAHIPFLSKILYQIPFLNNVRCPSRVLFLFVLLELTVIAIVLSYMCSDKHELLAFGRYLVGLAVVLTLAVFLTYFTPLHDILSRTGEINEDIVSVFSHSVAPVLLLLVIVDLGNTLIRCNHIQTKAYATGLAGIIVLISIVEVWPYATENGFRLPIETLKLSSDFQIMADNIGDGKTITTYSTYDGNNYSETSGSNRQFYTGIPSLNAYLTYNNPALYQLSGQTGFDVFTYYNYSGLQTGYTSIRQLLQNNDVLSILGVRYIEDQQDLLDKGCPIKGKRPFGEAPAVKVEQIEIVPSGNNYEIVQFPLQVSPDTFYDVSFTLTTQEAPAWFYMDLYGSDYDNSLQDVGVQIKPCENKGYALTIYSGVNPVPDNTVLRVVSACSSPIFIRNLTVNQRSSIHDVYVPLHDGRDNLYYENTRAKDLFYTVPYLEGIESMDAIALNPFGFDFVETSYIIGMDSYDYSNASTQITNTIWVSNHTAITTVETDADTFVTFSQCYDPAWRVYLDDVRVENYQTNLALQGIFVPAGKHTITYKYCPVIVYISLGVSSLTALLSSIYICVASHNSRRYEMIAKNYLAFIDGYGQ